MFKFYGIYHISLLEAQCAKFLKRVTFIAILSGSNGMHFNILRPRKNGRDFADDILKGIFLSEIV